MRKNKFPRKGGGRAGKNHDFSDVIRFHNPCERKEKVNDGKVWGMGYYARGTFRDLAIRHRRLAALRWNVEITFTVNIRSTNEPVLTRERRKLWRWWVERGWRSGWGG